MGKNARAYWEMFDGVEPAGQPNLYVRYVDFDVDVGGFKSYTFPTNYQLAVYGRRTLEGDNLETIATEPISITDAELPGFWRRVHIRAAVTSTHVLCVVAKMENLIDATGATGTGTAAYRDQYNEALGGGDPPAWGFRIPATATHSVYGSQLGRNVRPDLCHRRHPRQLGLHVFGAGGRPGRVTSSPSSTSRTTARKGSTR